MISSVVVVIGSVVVVIGSVVVVIGSIPQARCVASSVD